MKQKLHVQINKWETEWNKLQAVISVMVECEKYHEAHKYQTKASTLKKCIQDAYNILGEESDSDFILESFKKLLIEQENNIVEYMNKYMTQEERNKHGDNIWGFLARADGALAKIRMEMMADGRQVK